MIHLIYVCSASGEPSEQDLLNLLNQARSRNLEQNITGMLLYDSGTYMQILEGSEKDVHDIFNSIRRDPRVSRMVTLVEEKISQRNFPHWSMGFRNLQNSDPEELPGYTDIFNGKLDTEIAANNEAISVNLIMSFVDEAGSLKP